jgi:hypothetical protein
LSHNGIALNVHTQLLGRKARPDAPAAPIRSIVWLKRSNINISVLNPVFFRRKTVNRFEAKPHACWQHDLDALNLGQNIRMPSNPLTWQYGKILRRGGRNM